MANKTPYFTHDADMRNNRKTKALVRRFGNEGYAIWCYLLETLTMAEDFEIRMTDKDLSLYAGDFNVDEDFLAEILAYMEETELITRKDNRIYCEEHKRRMQFFVDAKNKRIERAREGGLKSAEKRRIKAQEGQSNFSSTKVQLRSNFSSTEVQLNSTEVTTKEKDKKKEKESSSLQTSLFIEKEINKEKEKEKEYPSKEVYEKENLSPSIRPFPYKKIVDLWNSYTFPKVITMSEARKLKLKLRMEEMTKNPEEYEEKAKELFDKMAKSKFLKGENETNWVATFDWIISNSTNWLKVMEGNYDDKNRTAQRQNNPNLGEGEWMDGDRRTYDTGRITVPKDAPKRPDKNHVWAKGEQRWVYSLGF